MNKKVIVRATLLLAGLVAQGAAGCVAQPEGGEAQVVAVTEQEVHVAFSEAEIDAAIEQAALDGGSTVLVASAGAARGLDVSHVELKATLETLRAAKEKFATGEGRPVNFIVPIERIINVNVHGGFDQEGGDYCMYNKAS